MILLQNGDKKTTHEKSTKIKESNKKFRKISLVLTTSKTSNPKYEENLAKPEHNLFAEEMAQDKWSLTVVYKQSQSGSLSLSLYGRISF